MTKLLTIGLLLFSCGVKDAALRKWNAIYEECVK